LAERLTRNAALTKAVAARNPGGGMAELRRLHYDVTTSTSRPALSALRELVPVSQMLFGTDFPYLPPAYTIKGLDAYGFSEADLGAINRGNALRLFPRFAT
jgi:6-methylsalicylate decarboxylase